MNQALLLIQKPDGSLREEPLATQRVVLGRGPECDIVLAGRLVSRQHAAISRLGPAYMIEDLGSRNGTTVNDEPLSGQRILRDGDRIDLGGIGRLTFVDGDATSTRPVPHAVGIWLDAATQDTWVDGQRLDPKLSLAQFVMLQTLVACADQICSRDEIVAAVWPDVIDGVSDEALDALVKRVRARLAEVAGGQRYLTTLRGRGLMVVSRPARPAAARVAQHKLEPGHDKPQQ
jgi:DNA-binding winged helix-turn-helix (wHTH) protein